MKTIVSSLILLMLVACAKEHTTHSSHIEKRALIVVSSHDKLGNTGKQTGWYLSEVSHVYYPLIEAGYSIDFASPKGGEAAVDQKSVKLDDAENKKFVEEMKMNKTLSTVPLSKINPKLYQVIHFAGGHGAMWDFHNSSDLNDVAAEIYENGGIVSAVCHGPAALVNIKLTNGKYLVDGKEVATFTNAEEKEVGLTKVVPFLLETKLKERGAKVQTAKNWSDKVVVSERLITGQNPQSAASLGKTIVETSKKLK
jgi:putative intracellular protease/amidase